MMFKNRLPIYNWIQYCGLACSTIFFLLSGWVTDEWLILCSGALCLMTIAYGALLSHLISYATEHVQRILFAANWTQAEVTAYVGEHHKTLLASPSFNAAGLYIWAARQKGETNDAIVAGLQRGLRLQGGHFEPEEIRAAFRWANLRSTSKTGYP
jgi:hypothetical protein